MGACATKPKVLKDGDEKPISQPEPPPPPQKEVEEKKEEVVQRETAAPAPAPAAVAPVENDLPKNPSLGNLFDKESEDAKVSPGIVSDKGKAIDSSQESDAIKAPEVVASGSKEALEVLPAPSATVVSDAPVEKEAIKAPEVIPNENAEALPVAPTAISGDVPVEKEAVKAPEVIASENAEALPVAPAAISADVPVEKEAIKASEVTANEPSGTIVDAPVAKENDVPVEKLDSKTSEIVPEDFADALPAPVVVAAVDAPVDDAASEIVSKENANASENVKEENVGEKSVAETEVYYPTNKIVSQYSEEYTDALPDAVAPTLNTTNANNPIQSIEQTGEEEKSIPVQEDAFPLNIEDKKTVEVENAVEKQAESTNPTQESDVKQAKPVEILPDK